MVYFLLFSSRECRMEHRNARLTSLGIDQRVGGPYVGYQQLSSPHTQSEQGI